MSSVIRLCDVAEVTIGGVWGDDCFRDGLVAVRCLRGVDVHALAEGAYADPPIRWISGKQLESRRLRAGQIVIEGSGSNCGRSVCVTREMVGRWAEPVVYSNFCKRIQLTDSEYVPQFIGWLIRGCYLNGVVQKWRTGTSVPNLDIAALLSGIVVPGLPRLAQVSVAGFLDRISGKIELNRKMNQTLEEMAQAIFKSWFIDFDGHDPADLVESELGPIPRGWGVTTVKEAVSELETGSRPKGGVAKYTSGVPSIGAESITGLGEYDYSKTKFIPPDFFAAMRRGVLRSRDLLIYKDGGKPGDYRPHVSMFGDGFPFVDASINSHVYRLRAADGLTQEYLYFWFSSAPVMEEMKRRGTGAAIPSLPRTNLYSMPILIPAESRLHDFQDVAEPLVGRVLSNSLQSRTLAELRDTLLPKLISGEIRVPEPEEQVEAAL